MTLNMMVGNLRIGLGRLDNVKLVPGNNTLPLKANVDLQTVLRNFGPILASEGPNLLSGNLVLSASGNSTIYEGHHVDYYEKVLNNLTLTTKVPILRVLTGTLGGFLEDSSGSLQDSLSNINVTGLLSGLNGSGLGSISNSTPSSFR